MNFPQLVKFDNDWADEFSLTTFAVMEHQEVEQVNDDTSQTGTPLTRSQQKSPITVESLDRQLLMYSTTHQKYAEIMSNENILSRPEDFLGPNYQTVLNFWTFLDSLSEEQRKEVRKRDRDLARDVCYSACEAANNSARKMLPYFFTRNGSIFGGQSVALSTAWDATCELIGMNTLLYEGKSLTFVPLFSNL